MTFIDYGIFVLYLLAMLGVGYYFLKKNHSDEDYYVGGRNMGSFHVGLSVVATDVGGGFSIGLGGLGFTMGLSGSWMLLTGLIGAWLTAVILVPKVFRWAQQEKLLTFPQLFGFLFDKRVAAIAAVISLLGYIGMTSSQLFAGATLAAGTIPELSSNWALLIMGAIAVIYTVMGGIKAVIYTDTFQWSLLLIGLFFVGIPMAYNYLGGWEGIAPYLSDEQLSLSNITGTEFFNWMITIIPIWFVGMTLYQRIYACRTEKDAKKAWFIAGLFEWPVMAFLGVILGLLAKVALDKGMLYSGDVLITENLIGSDVEKGLPMLLTTVLPTGFLGIMMAAYFSAIMSTADSCLMAASGNWVSDVFPIFSKKKRKNASQWATLIIGIFALGLAYLSDSVLSLMLASYAFMVSGLLVPLVAGVFFKARDSSAAIGAMITGGLVTLSLQYTVPKEVTFGLDPNIFGISAAIVVYFVIFKRNKLKL